MQAEPGQQPTGEAVPDCDISDLDLEYVSSRCIRASQRSHQLTATRHWTYQRQTRSLASSMRSPGIYRIAAGRAATLTAQRMPMTLMTTRIRLLLTTRGQTHLMRLMSLTAAVNLAVQKRLATPRIPTNMTMVSCSMICSLNARANVLCTRLGWEDGSMRLHSHIDDEPEMRDSVAPRRCKHGLQADG